MTKVEIMKIKRINRELRRKLRDDLRKVGNQHNSEFLKQELSKEYQRARGPREVDLKKLDKQMTFAIMPSKDFYRSAEWKQLRYRVLKEQGNRCVACGTRPEYGAVIQVDHIKPRSLYPELSLEYKNLQVLCKHCNEGKSNKDKTDWR